jgi:hypothetical protein
LLAPAIALVLIAALAATFVCFRRNLPYKLESGLGGNPRVLLSLSDVVIVGRAGGRKAWSFKARRADVSQGRVRTTFLAIRDGKIYDEKGSPVLRVNAGRAAFISGVGDVEVSDGVKVVSSQGYTAAVDAARWSGYFQQLTCPGKVTFTVGRSKLVGRDLVVDWKRGEATLQDGRMVVSVSNLENLGEEGSGAGKERSR